ncbi:hypothetical protein RRG08_028392 [Elysia crispata]|uniref:C2H2-type domain-containing protein n=1 Tax=Elysia crispata TaxID=231223 RepID=A0AAE1E521_9GAST|nr:hypothetical protein RRG08_028392 [Elysia crispata]
MLVETPNKEKGRLKPKTMAMERMSIIAKLTRGLIIGARLVALGESMIQLIQHVRLHIVQDINSCDKCPSKFNTRAELQDHILQVHREGAKCHLCGRVFSQRTRLLTNLRLQHCTTLTEPESSTKCLTHFVNAG